MKTSKILTLCFALVATCSTAFSAMAYVPYDSYIYSTSTGRITAEYSPVPYVPARTIDRASLGVPLVQPIGMCFDKDMNLYITDAGTNALVIVDKDYQVVKRIEDFENNGLLDFFGGPEGVFVADNGDIYICDTNQKRIIVLDKTYQFKQEIKDVVPANADEYFVFLPSKIAVDASGNLFVISKNEYSGILQLDPNGKFLSFIGSNKVVFDPITKLWKKIMSKEQREQMEQFLPVEYTNLQMDNDGFFYTVSKSEDSTDPIKRLNPSGKDVLIKNGYVGVAGDVRTADMEEKDFKPSAFVDVCPGENGLIYALDVTKGRIFVYNNEGFLFYAFGGLGQQLGTFVTPSAIEVRGSDVLVADQTTGRITVFKRTAYGNLIDTADYCYSVGEYETSVETWREVVKLNSNFELAYAQIGKVYLRQKRNEEAMQYFMLGNYRGDKITGTSGYNKAFFEYRRQIATAFFGPVVVTAVVFIVAGTAYKRYRKRRRAYERKS